MQQKICVFKQKNVFLNYFSERSKQHIAKLKNENASQAIWPPGLPYLRQMA
jgi:hypothetical protein